MQKYDNEIQDQLTKGVIERVETNQVHGTVHYLPHQETSICHTLALGFK